MLYMDRDKDLIFKGILNRSVLNSAIEFVIENQKSGKSDESQG